ncbi:hypothetical protein MIR68_007357 [Amoeboaphelidium protococcarum]|nr:hypothetical protein MIR68_007357 [Amoeboaphelidium protococcarum]
MQKRKFEGGDGNESPSRSSVVSAGGTFPNSLSQQSSPFRFQSMEAIKKSVECPICLNGVADRMLNCDHSLCHKCVQQLFTQAISDARTAQRRKVKVKCPICRQEWQWSADKSSQFNLDTLTSTVRQNFTATGIGEWLDKMVFCEAHSDMMCTHFCMECRAPTCAQCQQVCEQEHDTPAAVSFDVASKKMLSSLGQEIGRVSQISNNLQSFQSDIVQVEQQMLQKLDDLERIWIKEINHQKQLLHQEVKSILSWHEQQLALKYGMPVERQSILVQDMQKRLFRARMAISNPANASNQKLLVENLVQTANELAIAGHIKNAQIQLPQLELMTYMPFTDGLLGQIIVQQQGEQSAQQSQASTSSRQKVEEQKISQELGSVSLSKRPRTSKLSK